MARPILMLAIVCLVAPACSPQSGSTRSSDTTPASQKAGDQPAPSSATPAPARPAPPPVTAPQASEAEKPDPMVPISKSGAPRTAKPISAASPSAAARGARTTGAPPAPEFREFIIPAGRTITVTLTTPVASDTSQVEDPVRGTLAQPIVVSGTTVVPAGAEVTGTVIEASESGRVKGRASVAFRFERVMVGDESHDIRTAQVVRRAAASQGDDLKKGGIGAGVGAIVGGIAGGRKGAAIGAGVGGTGAVLATRGKEVRLPVGTAVTTTLQQSVSLSVPSIQK